MRSARIVILVLAFNALALWYFSRSREGAPLGTASGPSTRVVTQVVMSPTPAPVVTVVSTNSFHWGQLETSDYREFIARLRAIGCPEQTIRDLVIADIDKLYAAKVQSLRPVRKSLQYWQSEEAELANNQDVREAERREREIERDKARVIRDLLGVDLVAERQRIRGQKDTLERRLAFLPEERRAELRQKIESWQDRELAMHEKSWDSGAALSAEDRTALRLLRQEREDSLSQLLSPEERSQFDLWMSPTADSIRHDAYGMDINEQEFQAIYALRKEFDQAWPRDEIDPADEGTLNAWGEALLQLEEQTRGALGNDRFAMYQRGQDAQFHELNVTASRFQIPREKAAEAYEYLRLSRLEQSRVSQNSSLSLGEQTEILRRIGAETDRAVREVLGDGPFHYFSRISK